MSESEMTIEEAIAHGREWIAAGWEWAPGQVALATVEVTGEVDRERYLVVGVAPMMLRVIDIDIDRSVAEVGWEPSLEFVPDLRDDGTQGHALGQVRRVWGQGVTIGEICGPNVHSLSVSSGMNVLFRSDDASRAARLLAARRAAP